MKAGAAETGTLHAATAGDCWVLIASGSWTIGAAGKLAAALAAAKPGKARRAQIDLSRLAALDTAGAWLIHRAARDLRVGGIEVEVTGANPAQARLLERITEGAGAEAAFDHTPPHPVRAMIERTGKATFDALAEGRDLLAFLGLVTITVLRTIGQPRRLRLKSVIHHMEHTGLDALPIVGLLAFLIGIVLAFQGADQLRQFGAEIFTINLLGVSVLREIGILLTAILVAGRSGSAFTAQIGTMKVNEEVDALRTLGLDPIELLVLPRMIAVIITLPLLVFFADMMALLGGGLMAILALDLSLTQFLRQLEGAITLSTFLTGLAKAPVFAALIAMVGCRQGLKVEGSAESVGRLTTQAVVESIFLVMVADAMFSILYSYLGL